MPQMCPNCGQNNRDTGKFCAFCQTQLMGLLGSNTTLQGRYRIISLLGCGGMGAVYLVEDTRLGPKKVAVKENFDISPQAQQQFQFEAHILANLDHPHLPKVTDHFIEATGRQYLVMEYVEGEDLETLRQHSPQGQLPEAQVLAWVDNLLDALAYLHSQPDPIIHRDIKPANIKLTPQGKIKLVDFGIAKIYRPGQATQTAARYSGSPGFAPVEQYAGGTEARSDIYALGATLYCLLTGQPPPESAVLAAGQPLLPPRKIRPDLSPQTQKVIFQAMAVNITQRFQNAAAMRQALQGRPMTPPPAPVPTSPPVSSPSVLPTTKTGWRSWPWAMVGCGAVLLLAICGAISYMVWSGNSAISSGVTMTNTPGSPDTSLPFTGTPTPTATPTVITDTPTPTNTSLPLATTPALTTSPPTEMPTTTPLPTPTPALEISGIKAVGESYSNGNLSLTLSEYDIGNDGRIWLKFLVTNQSSQKTLVRYQNSYFSITDDTGKAYPQDEDFLVEAKQYELPPGESFELSGDSYPDHYSEVGYFYGIVSEQASHLIVKVSQFADLRDMQWRIPLNAQLVSLQSSAPGTQQPLLDGFAANGITMLLSDYNVESDGRIWLKFLVRNEGNNPVLIRYQNKYFEIYDDLGNRHEPDEDFLIEPKQVLLAPGKSFELSGDSYPDHYSEIGYFYGNVVEQASYLLVKVSQFADLRDMQWRIPLNAQLVSPQIPGPSTQQPMLEGFSANGITMLLSDYSVESNGRIWLKFQVRNEGNNAVLIRYQNKYFELYDDLGNRYDPDEDFLAEPKQVLLPPDKSFELSGDSYPDHYSEIGYFYGTVPAQAKALIIKVSQLADLRDMQWQIPLN